MRRPSKPLECQPGDIIYSRQARDGKGWRVIRLLASSRAVVYGVETIKRPTKTVDLHWWALV